MNPNLLVYLISELYKDYALQEMVSELNYKQLICIFFNLQNVAMFSQPLPTTLLQLKDNDLLLSNMQPRAAD